MFPSVEENIELVAILTFSSGLLGNRSSERLWLLSNELILKNFSFCRKLKFFRGDHVFDVFVQVLVLTVGGGLGVLGWSRAVCGAGLFQWSSKILPAPSCVSSQCCGCRWTCCWISWICLGSCCDTSYCRPIDGNNRFI